jgi:chromosomal replication initiator protein
MELIKEKWDEIKETLRREFDVLDVSYNTWIRPLKFFEVENNTVIIMVNSDQSQTLDYIVKKFKLQFKTAIGIVTKKEYEVKFILENEVPIKQSKNYPNSNKKINHLKANLNPRYTFDTFIVGNNNRFPHSAALAVAESPGNIYNPLFIYGGTGLGKTHLMHSIGHFILDENPVMNVLYVTSEVFTNEIIEAVRDTSNTTTLITQFRDKYRNIDVLLIDDIQFIIGKERTQEEFFHTFNELYSAGKAIIISSDKSPKSMTTLDERFRSRFEWGLIADINSPDYETRMAILRKKAEFDGIKMDDEIIQYIATNIKSNIRELEGALNRLSALSNLNKMEINMSLAEEALKDIIDPDAPMKVTPELIIKVVSEHFNVSSEDICSKKRPSEIAYPRQIVMYLCRDMTEVPLKNIGSILGGKDHSTVKHGCDKISGDIKKDPKLKNTIDILKKKINFN